MKNRSPIDSSILEFFILLLLVMISFFYLNGCTDKVLQVAKDKSSPENAAYWKIKGVVSAVKHENGDISVCVDLNESGETGKPLNIISLSIPTVSVDTDAIERLRPRSEECFFDDATCYWYPIEKTKRGCASVGLGTSSPASVFPIEKIRVNKKGRHHVYNLLTNFNNNQPVTERIFEVSFVSDEEDTPKDADADNDEVLNDGTDSSKVISLIYWQAQIDQQDIQPIIISGVYEDNSTNLYYLLVPLAVAGDVAYEITILAARLSICIMSSGHICE